MHRLLTFRQPLILKFPFAMMQWVHTATFQPVTFLMRHFCYI